MIVTLNCQEFAQFANLRQAYRSVQLAYPVIITYKWVQVGTAVNTFMIVPVVLVAIAFCVRVLIIS